MGFYLSNTVLVSILSLRDANTNTFQTCVDIAAMALNCFCHDLTRDCQYDKVRLAAYLIKVYPRYLSKYSKFHLN